MKRRIFKNIAAACILGFSLLLSMPVLTAIFGLNSLNMPFVVMKAEKIGFALINGLYFAIPYIMIVFLFAVLLLYKSIILKCVMIGLFPISLLYQIGMLMGFTSYLHFLIFLPQIVLISLGFYALIKTHNRRISPEDKL